MDELEYIEYENAPKRNVSDTDVKLLKLLGLL